MIGVAVLLLCGVMLAGGYFLGRQTASESESVAVDGVDSEVVVDDAGVDDAPAGDTPTTDTTDDTPTEENTVAEPDAPTAIPTSTPDGTLSRQVGDAFTEEDLAILWEVWQLVQAEFDGDIPDDEVLRQAAIAGVLGALGDQFTRYTPPEIAERSREDLSGTFEGIGAFVRENDEGMTEIVRPIDGQPADEAGLQAGDVVVAVDGESMIGRSLEEVISLIRGPRGTDVTIAFEREGLDEPFTVTITRARVEIPIVESEMLEGDIAYIRLTSFSRNAEMQMQEHLDVLLAENPAGLILDLRDNPGGFLDQAINISDLFLESGVVLYERSTTYDINETFSANDDGVTTETIPMVVLINAGSASASEIVAGAIRDNGRAILLGETTFGKGSVQQSHTLSDGSELRVTIARWYIPSDTSIDDVGIEPDIFVETPEDLGGEDDTQLQRAIEYLLTGE